MNMEQKVAKFNLIELLDAPKKNTYYEIDGLKKIFYRTDDDLPFYGICGLVKIDEYPGYCVLCSTFTNRVDYNNVFNIEFRPLYTENGEVILIKSDNNAFYCNIDQIPYHFKSGLDMDTKNNNLMFTYLPFGVSLDYIINDEKIN